MASSQNSSIDLFYLLERRLHPRETAVIDRIVQLDFRFAEHPPRFQREPFSEIVFTPQTSHGVSSESAKGDDEESDEGVHDRGLIGGGFLAARFAWRTSSRIHGVLLGMLFDVDQHRAPLPEPAQESEHEFRRFFGIKGVVLGGDVGHVWRITRG